jgi:hypothetical protein
VMLPILVGGAWLVTFKRGYFGIAEIEQMSCCSQAKRHEPVPTEVSTDTDMKSIKHDEQ